MSNDSSRFSPSSFPSTSRSETPPMDPIVKEYTRKCTEYVQKCLEDRDQAKQLAHECGDFTISKLQELGFENGSDVGAELTHALTALVTVSNEEERKSNTRKITNYCQRHFEIFAQETGGDRTKRLQTNDESIRHHVQDILFTGLSSNVISDDPHKSQYPVYAFMSEILDKKEKTVPIIPKKEHGAFAQWEMPTEEQTSQLEMRPAKDKSKRQGKVITKEEKETLDEQHGRHS